MATQLGHLDRVPHGPLPCVVRVNPLDRRRRLAIAFKAAHRSPSDDAGCRTSAGNCKAAGCRTV